jgi:hypothetical protein
MADHLDSLFFLTVARSDGGSLESFIATADALDHSVPTFAEYGSSVPRLVGAGLVACLAESLHLTAAGQELFAALGGESQPFIRQIAASKNAVARAVAGRAPAPAAVLVSGERFSEAVATYLQRHP